MKSRAEKMQLKVGCNQSALTSWLRRAKLLRPGEIATIEVQIRIKDKVAQKEDRQNAAELTAADWQKIFGIHWSEKAWQTINDLHEVQHSPDKIVLHTAAATTSIESRMRKLGKPYRLQFDTARRSYRLVKINNEQRTFVASSKIEA